MHGREEVRLLVRARSDAPKLVTVERLGSHAPDKNNEWLDAGHSVRFMIDRFRTCKLQFVEARRQAAGDPEATSDGRSWSAETSRSRGRLVRGQG